MEKHAGDSRDLNVRKVLARSQMRFICNNVPLSALDNALGDWLPSTAEMMPDELKEWFDTPEHEANDDFTQ